MTREKWMILFFVAVFMFAIAAYKYGWADDSTKSASVTITCTEDMPCWDCNTMGNRLCGPQP